MDRAGREGRRWRPRGRRAAWVVGVLASGAAATLGVRALLPRGEPTYGLVAILGDVTRIGPGTPVTVAGRRVGSVVYLRVRESGEGPAGFVVHLRVATAAAPAIRRDSELRLARPGILGARALEIEPGTDTAPALRPGDTLRATPPVLPGAIAAQARELADGLRALAGDAAELRDRSEAAVASLEARVRRLEEVGAELDAAAAAYRAGPGRLPEVEGRVRHALTAMDSTLAAFGERGKVAGDSLAAAAGRAAELRARIAALADGWGAESGFPARMATDSALVRALREARAEFDSLLARVRRAPLELLE